LVIIENMKNCKYPILIILILVSCRKPYNPPVISSPISYPVVEGTINTLGITTIKLSRTVSLSSSQKNPALTGATVVILSSQGSAYPLTEAQPGQYQSVSLNLDNSQQYRLSVKVSTGEQYLSDFESVAVSPPIDSVGYSITGNGVQLYVSTHDPTNNTKYFRWDFNETWKFHSFYESDYVTNGKAILPRTLQQQVYYCYASDTATNIFLANTSHLSQSVIYQNPLTTIAPTSEKVENEYTIQVNQYALSGDAYNFWNNLKENSENLGSIFDPLPSEISGNIHSVNNTAQLILGYVGVCAIQTKRVFIYRQALPNAWQPTYPYPGCAIDTEYLVNPVTRQPDVELNLVPLNSLLIPVTPIFAQDGAPIGYSASNLPCADCAIRGTTTVPIFWQ
jgi:hypothetical protein